MEMILDGVKLMVIGMVTVYIFLTIMIFCMNVSSKLLTPIAAKLEKKTPKPANSSSGDEALRAAVAAVAFHENSK
ncbi:MAG: oxaloacetate decarboxylase subunit gamma [Lentisphaerae bacterium ADurb.Bin242]|nr:MAG: oxaloacetate decarboxylase subunit gamma [Lentisphaerae bacterium ADurb.Bin242]